MDKEVICEVLSRLIGYTEPTGDSTIDKIRAENNSTLIYVTYQCIETLIENAENRNSGFTSVERIGKHSYDALNNIVDMITDSGMKGNNNEV
jgi:hypothetical protein|nr:MAG TPA: hypothetical protein [Caudoviricetes sp.]